MTTTKEKRNLSSPRATEEQIAAWKQEFEDVYELDADEEYYFYFKRPNRKVISLATTQGRQDPVKFAEVLINNCLIGGNKDVLASNDSVFNGVMTQLDVMIDIAATGIKKL